jgi:hypothetical protein
MRSATSDSWTAIKAENRLADERGRRLTRVEWSNVVVMKKPLAKKNSVPKFVCLTRNVQKSVLCTWPQLAQPLSG